MYSGTLIALAAFFLLQYNSPVLGWTDPAAEKEGIRAEIIQIPSNESPPTFALSLIESEGLLSADGEGIAAEPDRGPMGYVGIISGDGRNVRIYYQKDWHVKRSNIVCRIKEDTISTSETSRRASQWCAEQFGVEWPNRTSPLIIEQ